MKYEKAKHDYEIIYRGKDWALTRKCKTCGFTLIRDENYQHTFYGGTNDPDKCIERKIDKNETI